MSYPIEASTCPYCHKQLEKIPTRSAKCPTCKNKIIIKKISGKNSKVLATEQESAQIDSDNKEFTYRKRWMSDLEDMGVPEARFSSTEKKLKLELGRDPEAKEVVAKVINQELYSESNADDFRKTRSVYFVAERFMKENGQDTKPLIIQRLQHEITNQFKILGLPQAFFIFRAENNPCGYCAQFSGNRYEYNNAFDLIPLLVNNCEFTSRSCGCGFDLDMAAIPRKAKSAVGCALILTILGGAPLLFYML